MYSVSRTSCGSEQMFCPGHKGKIGVFDIDDVLKIGVIKSVSVTINNLRKHFFESLIISPKIPFDELFLKTILKTSGDIYSFENFQKTDRTPKVPIFGCKLCTKAQHHRILQKSPVRFCRLLTKPSPSFYYVWHMIKYPYLTKWPFLTVIETTTGECLDRW